MYQDIYLLLGSNQGSRGSMLAEALVYIEAEIGNVIRESAVYETASWGNEQLPPHLNQVVGVQTLLSPVQLLAKIQWIEQRMGRTRVHKWGLRTIDIDILFYGNEIIETEELTIPHPLLHQRRFTLVPLAEIAAALVHPKLQKNILDLLDQCEDRLEVHVYAETKK